MAATRISVIAVITAVSAALIYFAIRATQWNMPAVGAVWALSTLILLYLLIKHIPAPAPHWSRRDRVLLVIWFAATLVCGFRMVGNARFMLDAARTECAVSSRIRPMDDPETTKPFLLRHNCFTCYVVATHLATDGVDNLYLPERYRDAVEETSAHQTIGDTFTIDRYQYPPPFLLLPRLLMATGGDFFQVRTYWHVLAIAVFSVAIGAMSGWLGGAGFNRFWLLWPLILLLPTTGGSLQIGNVHFLIIAMCVLAMAAIESDRWAIGGALLGFAVVSKVFPGLLLVYLVFRRRWRAVAATAVCMILFTMLTWAIFGGQPFRDFLTYQLPRLLNGDAFDFARTHAKAITVNSSVYGVPYKLLKLGVLGEGGVDLYARILTWAYTPLILIVTAVAGMRGRTTHNRIVCGGLGEEEGRTWLAAGWLCVIVLAQMRSPFLPWGYGTTAVVWLIGLLLVGGTTSRVAKIMLAACLTVFALHIPLPYGPPTATIDLLYTLAALCITLTVVSFAMYKACRRRPVRRLATVEEHTD